MPLHLTEMFLKFEGPRGIGYISIHIACSSLLDEKRQAKLSDIYSQFVSYVDVVS